MMAGDSELPVDAPAQAAGATLKATFRRKFNQQMFGSLNDVGHSQTEGNGGLVVSPTQLTNCTKQMTQKRWSEAVEMVEEWGSTEDPNKPFRKANRLGYAITKKYHLMPSTQVDAGGSEVTTLIHTKTGGRVVPQLEVFDAIYDIHYDIGHRKSKATLRTVVKDSFYNVTETQVEKFLDLCPVCVCNKETKRDAVAKTPSMDFAQFRDRFHISLIDFRNKAMKDVYGRTMRWLTVTMDQCTRLVYIRCIPRRRPKYVAFELNQVFGLIGCPRILHIHTENGKEFTAQVILDMKAMNSSIITVAAGGPGHVETRVTKLVKRVTANLEDTERQNGRTPNWTMLQGNVMSVVNKQSGKGKNSLSAYEKVYGMRHDPLIPCSLETKEEEGEVELLFDAKGKEGEG
jgi:hypothetical protein